MTEQAMSEELKTGLGVCLDCGCSSGHWSWCIKVRDDIVINNRPLVMSGNPEAHDYEGWGGSTSSAPGELSLRPLVIVKEEPPPESPAMIEQEPSPWDRIRLAREGLDVERCHTHPHRDRYSVGHHSAGVAMLIAILWPVAHGGEMCRAELLAAALFHDVPERITGDVPQPIADLLGKGALEEMERRVLTWLDAPMIPDHLTAEEAIWLHAADRLELYLWCLEQERNGDLTFHSWVVSYEDGWRDKPLPPVFMDVVARARLGVPRLRWDELREIAGI